MNGITCNCFAHNSRRRRCSACGAPIFQPRSEVLARVITEIQSSPRRLSKRSRRRRRMVLDQVDADIGIEHVPHQSGSRSSGVGCSRSVMKSSDTRGPCRNHSDQLCPTGVIRRLFPISVISTSLTPSGKRLLSAAGLPGSDSSSTALIALPHPPPAIYRRDIRQANGFAVNTAGPRRNALRFSALPGIVPASCSHTVSGTGICSASRG